mgnify:CR=1 FL=1
MAYFIEFAGGLHYTCICLSFQCLTCPEGRVVCGRDLDRLAGVGIPGLMCCYVSDIEGAKSLQPLHAHRCQGCLRRCLRMWSGRSLHPWWGCSFVPQCCGLGRLYQCLFPPYSFCWAALGHVSPYPVRSLAAWGGNRSRNYGHALLESTSRRYHNRYPGFQRCCAAD